MEILTTRFGPVTIRLEDRVEFPRGLVGVPHLRRFVTIRDPKVSGLTWLQSTRDPAWALALVSPRSFVTGYQVRSTPEHLQTIQVADSRDVDVYVTLNRTVQSYSVNLQAPILINRQRSIGMQLVLSDAQYSVRHLVNLGAELRKSA